MRYIHLDMVRGAAAVAVALSHVRGALLVDYADLESTSLALKALYFATGLGHQAVIVFFALSGFLVGGAAFSRINAGEWKFIPYIVARVTRLWVVAIPALLLTFALDTVGIAVTGGVGYGGEYHTLLLSGPSPTVGADLSFGALLGNVFFLQTIVTPTFGTNGPLWSLANEFWYYLVFPIALASVRLRSTSLRWRLIGAALSVGLLLVLPTELTALGAIWVAGALSYLCMRWLGDLAPSRRYAYLVCAALLSCAATVASAVLPRSLSLDLVAGVAWASLIPAIACVGYGPGWYRWTTRGLSEVSYTLYLFHAPVVLFLSFVFVMPNQIQPDAFGVAALCGTTVFLLAFSGLMWWLFERNSNAVRSWAMARLKSFS